VPGACLGVRWVLYIIYTLGCLPVVVSRKPGGYPFSGESRVYGGDCWEERPGFPRLSLMDFIGAVDMFLLPGGKWASLVGLVYSCFHAES
jgi:hypothetical protein